MHGPWDAAKEGFLAAWRSGSCAPQGHLTGPEREGSPLFSAAFLQYLAQGRSAPRVDLIVGDLVSGGQQVGRGGGNRRGRKSRKQRRQEFDEMQAPTIGGVRIKQGNGETVRLRRGSSLTDLAEKIGADPAALVQVLFNLGEMITATQSVPDETLEVLGAELNYTIDVVSPEDEEVADVPVLVVEDVVLDEDSRAERRCVA